jgi:hypothetical protein
MAGRHSTTHLQQQHKLRLLHANNSDRCEKITVAYHHPATDVRFVSDMLDDTCNKN